MCVQCFFLGRDAERRDQAGAVLDRADEAPDEERVGGVGADRGQAGGGGK